MRSKFFLITLISGAIAANFPQMAIAQDSSGSQSTAVAANAVCMMGPEPSATGGEILVIVTAGPDQTLAVQGFQPVPCPTDAGVFASYQTQMCQLANAPDGSGQDQFIQTYGVSPSDLCNWAGQVTGMP